MLNLDPITGVHTNRIESSWRPLKDYFRERKFHPDHLADHIVEYQWRRACRKLELEPFDYLLDSIINAYGDFDKEENNVNQK